MIKRTGLSSTEAQHRLREYGFNEIKDPGYLHPFKILLRQIKKNFIIYLLFLAALISFFVSEHVTGVTILLVLFLVIFVTFIQEYRAEKTIQALKGMIIPISIVIRDGKEQEVLSKELIPDDVIMLRSGEKIPADCVVIEEDNLEVNESILTGESREIKKRAAKDPKHYDDSNLLFMGSFVVNGKCLAQVLHTGMNTRFGGIAGMITEAEKTLPLQDKVNKLARYMVIVAVMAAFSTGLLIVLRTPLTSETLTNILILTIALAVSAFPEGLPVVLMTALAVGASRMAGKNAIVNRMSIIETLGETTVICADKTGTMTKGEMTVKKIFADGKNIEVGGTGFEATGDFSIDGQKINIEDSPVLKLLLEATVLCNDARIERTGEDKEYKIFGTPTEASLLILAAKGGVFREDVNCNRLEEIPFNSERKMMSVLCSADQENFLYLKGALEILLPKCKFVQEKDKKLPLDEKMRKEIIEANEQMTKNSYRSLVIAFSGSSTAKITEEDLTFLGLVGMDDPPREGIKEALEDCYNAGINVKMVTGDHKDTALAIASEIGLQGEVLEGDDLDKMSDDELAKIVGKVGIFARVRPEHKLRIIKVLKQNGEIVTMTGDGVNDAPALKEAHIGVAMGRNGTDVSRSAADLTLKDDNFATIVEAIREGRTIFNNIRKFVSYQFSCNFTELLVLFLGVLLAPILGWQIPILLALQILFMNLVTDDLPAITLAFNKSSKDVMHEKPRQKTEILNRPLLALTVLAALVMAFFTLASFFLSFNIFGQSLEIARTTALLTLILLEIANAFNFRSFRRKVLTRSPFVNIYLFWASIISILATLAIIYTALNHIFETTPLGILNWLVSFLAAVCLVAIFDLLKEINNRKHLLRLS